MYEYEILEFLLLYKFCCECPVPGVQYACRVARMIQVSTVCGRRVSQSVVHVPHTQHVHHVQSLTVKGISSFNASSVRGLYCCISTGTHCLACCISHLNTSQHLCLNCTMVRPGLNLRQDVSNLPLPISLQFTPSYWRQH